MIRRLIHIIVLMLIILPFAKKQALGQEFPWLLQYITNMHTVNPAYVGIWDEAGLMFSTRTNWIGIKGSPFSQQISYFTPVRNQRSGVGLNIQRMDIGRERQLFFTGDYSYQIRVNMNQYLRFGLRAGILNYDNNLSNYQFYPDHIPDPEYTTDVRLYSMTILGLGALFYTYDYYISISLPQIINNTFKVNRSIYSSTQGFKTIYLSGGYVFKLPKSIRIRPNLLVLATIGKSIYFDAATLVYLPSNLQLGVNIRSNGVVCFSGQYSFNNNLRIGYASEYSIVPDIRKYQLGTYEIIVGYDFNLYRKKYVRPNYF